jgi:hypothetical protein
MTDRGHRCQTSSKRNSGRTVRHEHVGTHCVTTNFADNIILCQVKPVVLHQMNQHPPPPRPGWRRVRYARKWFPSWAIGGIASLGRAARGAFACSGPRRATSHRCGRPERTSPSRKSWHRPRCLAERGHRSDREQAGQPAPRSRLRWEPPTIRPPTTGCYPSRPPSPAAVRSAATPTGAAQVALPYLPPAARNTTNTAESNMRLYR